MIYFGKFSSRFLTIFSRYTCVKQIEDQKNYVHYTKTFKNLDPAPGDSYDYIIWDFSLGAYTRGAYSQTGKKKVVSDSYSLPIVGLLENTTKKN